jgi:hypothetical protein
VDFHRHLVYAIAIPLRIFVIPMESTTMVLFNKTNLDVFAHNAPPLEHVIDTTTIVETFGMV